MRLTHLLPLALLVAGCGAAGSSDCPGPPQAILGTNVLLGFVGESTCAQVTIIKGPQGRYHIWGAVRARYIDFSGVKMHFTYTDPRTGNTVNQVDMIKTFDPVEPTSLVAQTSGGPPGGGDGCPDGGIVHDLAGPPAPSGVPGGTDGWGESLGNTVFLPQDWAGCQVHDCIDGHALKMRVDLEDRAGRTASDERLLVPTMIPEDVTTDCTGDVDAGIAPADLGGTQCP